MQPTYVKATFALILALAYLQGFLLVQYFTHQIPLGDFARSLGASDVVAAYTYMIGMHTLNVFIIALPIALIMPLIYKSQLFRWALLVSVLPAFEIVESMIQYPPSTISTWILSITDLIKFLVFIPSLAWLFAKCLPYNKVDPSPSAGTR